MTGKAADTISFILTGMGTGVITAVSIAGRSLSKTKRKSKMSKYAI